MDNEPKMHLDDEQMSLQSKIAGGGRDKGAEAGAEELRLCPACGRVTTFVQGKCSNCDYKPGMAAGVSEAASIRRLEGGGSGAVWRVLVIVLIIAVLGVGGYFLFTGLGKQGKPAGGPVAPAAKPGTAAETSTARPGPSAAPESHPGGLAAVTIDDKFHADLKAVIEKGNQAWKDAGTDSYAYRYGVSESTVTAVSQTLSISLYCGGADAASAVDPPANQPMRDAIQGFADSLDQRPGVSASAGLEYTGGKETPGPHDVYLRYGYYYGLEHMSGLQKVIDGLAEEHRSSGSYPDLLARGLGGMEYNTKGSLGFEAGGLGYLPIYKTDAKGDIIMGQGSGVASFQPEAVTGYYLMRFLDDPAAGLDMYSPEDYQYYVKYILPFPYQPEGAVHNMPLHPDGKPDGIACIVKSGELQK
jgi:hypothetical protein